MTGLLFFKIICILKSLLYPGPLQVCCGQAGVKGRYKIVNVPSGAALAEYKHVINCPPKDAAKFALRLFSVFFTEEQLAQSCCTKAEGRDLEILQGIKCMFFFCFMLFFNYLCGFLIL